MVLEKKIFKSGKKFFRKIFFDHCIAIQWFKIFDQNRKKNFQKSAKKFFFEKFFFVEPF